MLRLLRPLQVFGYAVLRNPDRSLESVLVEWDTDTEWASGLRVSTDVEWYVEDLREPLDLPGSTRRPVGRPWRAESVSRRIFRCLSTGGEAA